MIYCMISRMVSVLLNQLQFCLIELLRFLIGATRAGALDISKAFDRVCHGGFLHKVKSSGFFRSSIWPYFTFSQ